MREQEARERARNFMEVPYGYTPEDAGEEASRCLNCLKPTCRSGCPVEVDIPSFIQLIKEGKFIEAAWKIKGEERASRSMRQGMSAGNSMRIDVYPREKRRPCRNREP